MTSIRLSQTFLFTNGTVRAHLKLTRTWAGVPTWRATSSKQKDCEPATITRVTAAQTQNGGRSSNDVDLDNQVFPNSVAFYVEGLQEAGDYAKA